MECPRCDGRLRDNQIDEHPVHPCTSCAGMLLGRRALDTLFAQLSEGIEEDDGVPERVADSGVRIFCPKCAREMEHYGYLGANHVMIDRCGKCDLMWVDRGELDVMRAQWARSRAGTKQRQAKLEATVAHARSSLISAWDPDIPGRATRAADPRALFDPKYRK